MATASWPPTPKSPRPQAPSVERTKGPSGLDKVVLREARGFSAEVHLYGGQVTSWKNDRGDELLFVSSKFGTHGVLEKHGFARNRFWAIDDNPPPFPTSTAVKAFVDLILKPSEEDLKIWPHSFEFRLRVALGPGGDLALTSRIRNTSTDGRPFSFTFAYHTYFSVSDISCNYLSEVRIEGLETLDYIDCLRGKERSTEQGDAIVFESEEHLMSLILSGADAASEHLLAVHFIILPFPPFNIVTSNFWC
uniref:Glucose-6-phosphate 1-epimerase n=1 Tax=Oryza punctata TaxID=4537 RepID=A0A0E0KUT1_ORYPU